MPDSNLSTSIAAMRTSILSSLPTATVAELVDLSRASKSLNLGNDSTVETAINSRALALVNAGASQAEVIKISSAVKSVLSPSVLANNIANITTINSSIIPDTDIIYDLGSVSNRFNDLYLDGSTINLGGQTIKATANGIEVPEITIGTGTNKVKLVATATGELEQTGTDSSGNTAAPVTGSASSSSSVAVFADLASISGPTVGQSVLVIATNKLYIYIGTGWYMIAEVANENPTAITGANASYSLASDGTATTITAVSTDPEGATITWSHAVTSGALNGTTVTNVGNVFTITPHATQAATFDLTISASDGSTGTATHISSFTLSFTVEIEIDAWTDYVTNQSNSIAASTTGYISATMKNSSNTGPGNLPLSNVPLKQGRYYFEIKILDLGDVFPSLFTGYHTPFFNFGFVSHTAAVAGTLGNNTGDLTGSAALAKWQNGNLLWGSNQNGVYTQAPYPDLLAGTGATQFLANAGPAYGGFPGQSFCFAYDTSTKRAWIGYNGDWETGGTTHLGGDPTGTGVGSDLSNLASDDFGLILGNDQGSWGSVVWWGMLAQWMTASGGTPTYSPPSGFSHYNP
jgi:hypothetical protein